MIQNFSCVLCGGEVSFFCLCRSSKTYLCSRCLSTHITKEGAHFTVPISALSFVSHPCDLEAYNRRRTTTTSICAVLDSLSSDLEKEVTVLHEAAERERKACLADVNQRFNSMRWTLDRDFRAICSTISTVKEDLKRNEVEPDLDLTQETETWLVAACHLKEMERFFEEPQAVGRKRLDEEWRHPICEALERWKGGACRCRECVEVRDNLTRRKDAEWEKVEITGVERSDWGKLHVSGRCRNDAEVVGYLCVMQAGQIVADSPEPISFTGTFQIDISAWAVLAPGQYELCLHLNEAVLSNSFAFSLLRASPPSAYTQCFVFQNLNNIEEIEAFIRSKHGEAGFYTFARLASEWKNPSCDLLWEFLSAVMATNLGDESTARQALNIKGFRF